jgi:uracil-DNA glycosylase
MYFKETSVNYLYLNVNIDDGYLKKGEQKSRIEKNDCALLAHQYDIRIDSNYEIPTHGCLDRWSKEENILLLNCILTVKPKQSNSHKHLWSSFTDKLIKFISDNNDNTIFLLAGKNAINKYNLIDNKKHKIFITSHPSPLSARRGFFGSNIFKLINNYLEENNKKIINYSL